LPIASYTIECFRIDRLSGVVNRLFTYFLIGFNLIVVIFTKKTGGKPQQLHSGFPDLVKLDRSIQKISANFLKIGIS
jgi:hypothetical protein